ncbi:hypothetical protein EPN81_02210 [Patescibacteria group bacterium]|nr:MAG: hypothetical protein EPN81_02210 [Patescibacteria group bacterium]
MCDLMGSTQKEVRVETYQPEAWVYNPFNVERVLSQLPRELFDPPSCMALGETLRLHGGKTLGLRVCERVAESSPHLHIPPWTTLPAGFHLSTDSIEKFQDWIKGRNGPFKVRSSSRTEDWLSGVSGALQSRTVYDPQRVLNHAQEVSQLRDPVVVQKFVDGIGLVVDIAYSQIMRQPIVRISTGRELKLSSGNRFFSSSTWDHEGRHEVLDPLNGEPLLERCTGELFDGSCLGFPLSDLACELWQRIQDLGITFGVQLELVIHPDTPQEWSLVQIRPSPNRVRADGLTFSRTDSAIVTTPAVSRSFCLQAEAKTTTEDDIKWLFLAAIGGVDEAISRFNRTYAAPQILVWSEPMQADFNIHLLDIAFRTGARIQVTEGVITISTSHATIRNIAPSDQASLMSIAGIIAVPKKVHMNLLKLLHQEPRTLLAQSDGLVGQLAFP